jgi:nucleotide-binding universal stress UspA family protein
MSFRHILFPVDFSGRSYSAAPFVKAMADRNGAAITLLHVVESLPAWAAASDGGYSVEFDLPRMLEDARDKLAVFAAELFPAALGGGSTVNQLVEHGDPGSCIADLAKAWNTDLIMMPTHGHGRFRAALLGSTTAKVLHDAHCAVWTGVHLESPLAPAHTEIHTIMCAIDLQDGSAELIRYCASMAQETGANVYIVHAVPGAETRPQMYYEIPLETFLKDTARERIVELQKEAGTRFGVCLETGSVADVIRGASEHHNADLVVIGRGVISEFAGRLRTDAYGIMRDAPCPVLNVLTP